MRNIILLFTFCIGLVACGNKNSKSTTTEEVNNEQDRIEVLYFHGKQRCATCEAIEQNTQEVIESQFSNEMKDGSIILRIIDISQAENEKMADKYEVTWSSLILSKWKNGKEYWENITEYAFANAYSAPKTFKKELTEKIKELQK